MKRRSHVVHATAHALALSLAVALLPAAFAQVAPAESARAAVDQAVPPPPAHVTPRAAESPAFSPGHASAIGATVFESPEGVPVFFHGDTIATLHCSVGGITLERRAQRATALLEQMRLPRLLEPVRIEPVDLGFVVMVGDVVTFLVAPGDVSPGSGRTTRQVAEEAARRLGRALAARAQMLTPGYRLRAAIFAVAASIALYALLRLLGWARRRVVRWMAAKSEPHRGRLQLGDVDFIAQFSAAFGWVANIAAQIASLAVVALWMVFVLNLFPETRPWGMAARSALFNALVTFQVGLLRAFPGLVAVVLIAIGGRFATRLASDLFGGIERGTIRLPAVHPETAGATRRLVITLIWAFAAVVAYPLVPGSDSVAFKGVSVFIGLIVTLGSSGVVGHVMSGLVLVYSRALKRGDLVRVTDIEGIVTEVGALSVKVVNAKKEEFTIPNTVLVSTTVKNYSRQARESGGPLTVAVTIGYDAPWRVVNEMLLGAAARTPGVARDPAPVVYQSRLGDFAVEYQLVVRVERADRRFLTLSELNQNIQDAFNERGVQIMSPAFESQPEQPIVVPKSKWNRAPGDPPGEA